MAKSSHTPTPQAATEMHEILERLPQEIGKISDKEQLGTTVHAAFQQVVAPFGVDTHSITPAPGIGRQLAALPEVTRHELTTLMAVTGRPGEYIPEPQISRFGTACERVLPDMKSTLQRLGVR